MEEKKQEKTTHAEREEKILKFWKENGIFEKSLAKPSSRGEFVFYEGPPTANGRPGIHHLEARAFKDAIPRYKTMQGFHVRRKGGWDTHGLPVELQVEKELGLKSKKEIESFGISEFNQKCKESVWKYVHEWEDFTNRIGYWVDLENPYVTYHSSYIESVWNIMKVVEEKGLLYKDYKVVPWCPRCGTGLSSHELAQGYQDVKDLSVTVKFELVDEPGTFFLAWTTTPWTLPGNVGLAINPKFTYLKVLFKGQKFILEKSRALKILPFEDGADRAYVQEEVIGKNLIGLSYKPLYPFLVENISGPEKDKLKNAYKVYPADFVTTDDGTGIVHTAVMYGQDDFELGTKVGLPKYHLVNDDGTFTKETGFLAGAFVKDPNTDVAIIKDLSGRELLFAKEKYEHSYPFCWRCKTPLIYFARDSWYIKMSALRENLVKENKDIHWEPEHIKEGRFGEWLSEVKDWAVSRERYWGTPLPVWSCVSCKKRKVVGSVAEITKKSKNTYYIMRHGQSENNVLDILNSDVKKKYKLTEKGRAEVLTSAKAIGTKFDLIFSSPIERAKETAEIVAEQIGYSQDMIIYDDRLSEIRFGELDGGPAKEYSYLFKNRNDYFKGEARGVENRNSIRSRVGEFLSEVDEKYIGKNILIVSHDGPLWMIGGVAQGLSERDILDIKPRGETYLNNGEYKTIEYLNIPRNTEYELDLHRPYIDEVKLACECGGEMTRVKEVMDCWFDSGAMPFAEDHYPFDNKTLIDGEGYPAEFISEAIDQTRGWFYTLHAIGNLMGKGKAYKNVICLGHILDEKGKKMSKSLGNIVDPWNMMNKYGADALRFWMYSVNQPGDSKNFDEKTVDEVVKKVFNLTLNVLAFYELYAEGRENIGAKNDSQNILDRWIISRLNEVNINVTENLDKYSLMEPARTIRDFVADLSQWYLRRSRDRFKEEGEDKTNALSTMKYVLQTLAKIMAPFTPFLAEHIYLEIGGDNDSVHLESWPEAGKVDVKLQEGMKIVRDIASKGLEARMTAKINVRQPLSKLKYRLSVGKNEIKNLDSELLELIKDEVNVKEVAMDNSLEKEVELDLTQTPELKEEGEVRELLRKIQDLRKEKGLVVGDMAILIVTNDMKSLISKNGEIIKKSTSLKDIEFGDKFDLKV